MPDQTLPTSTVRPKRSHAKPITQPLPLPLAPSRTLLNFLFSLTPPPPKQGIFVPFGRCVLIVRRDDAQALWLGGFFGKGNLSRGEATWWGRRMRELGLNGGALSIEEITDLRRRKRREKKLGMVKNRKKSSELGGTGEITGDVIDGEESATDAVIEEIPKPKKMVEIPEGERTGEITGDVIGDKGSMVNAAVEKLSKLESVTEISEGERTGEITGDVIDGKGSVTNAIVEELSKPESEVEIPEIMDVEHHQLTLCEAFFLAYGLGALIVHNVDDKPISLSDLWQSFLTVSSPASNPLCPDNPFVVQYVAYHYYRSLGWVAKSGVKFGVDLVLYRKGPIYHHAEYAVIVIPTPINDSLSTSPHRLDSWEHLLGVHRVVSQVKKMTLLCYVLVPLAVTTKQMASPSCLALYGVREVIVKRWVPGRNRD